MLSLSQHILIVEDDPELSELIEFFLQMEGYSTEIVADGLFAFPKILEQKPGMVVLDMHLPHVSGLEILTSIRGESSVAQTKVLVTTADSVMAESAQPMADVILGKPFNADELLNVVHQLEAN